MLKDLHTLVRYWRTVRGLSQEELSKKSGVCRSSIVAAENATARPRGGNMQKLAAALGIEVTELYTKDPTYADGRRVVAA